MPAFNQVLRSAAKALTRLNEAPKYFDNNGAAISARAAHAAAGLVYHKNNFHSIRAGVALGLDRARRGAKASMSRFAEFAGKAGRDAVRHAKKITYDATLQMIKAGGLTAQGAVAAAGAAGKVTKEVASRTGQVARNVESACHAALGQLATQIKSRQDEPENYQYVEREGFHHEAFDPESCASTLGGIGEQCKEDHDVDTAYRDIYSRAAYLSQQDVPPQTQEVFSVDCQKFLLFMAQLYLNNLSELREHQQAKDTAAFTIVIVRMREQVLRWDPQQECRASFD